ncbi:glycosyltransferase [Bacillus sp. DJP31]|uniref:glycosyltransferase n=1 Tax=Bacillus sp. DJP31 TaxID=3409789 RepID=UPI003BB6197F
MIVGFLAILLFITLFWTLGKTKLDYSLTKYVSLECLSIIIPARNEEGTIESLLTSIRAQSVQPLEVIVVNDHSNDRTKEIALGYGVMVIDNPTLPTDWLGKSWACWNGAKAAKGEYLLFLDADTWFEKDGISKAMETYLSEENPSVLTIHPYHQMTHFYEKFSAIFQLIIVASSGISHLFANLIKTTGGFGQCMIVNRDLYFQIGGHKVIKHEVVENLSLVKHAASLGFSTKAISGFGILSMRMYKEGIGSLFNGWGKSFAAGSKKGNLLLTILVVLWISFLCTFLTNSISLINNDSFIFLCTYIAISGLLFRTLIAIGNYTIVDAVLFPLHLLFFVTVYSYSFISTYLVKNASWKGRSIMVSKRKDDQTL